MDFGSVDELWKALGRLYDDTLAMKESISEMRQSNEALSEATARLLNAVERHQVVVESHERRRDRTEITVEAILEDLRRHREGRAPQ
jgi:regulator of replication initiation timing